MISVVNDQKLLTKWKQVMFQSDRPVYRIGLLLLLGAVVLGGLSMIRPSGTGYVILKNAQLLSFIGLGCWLAGHRKRLITPLVRGESAGTLLFTTTLALVIFIVLVLTYMLSGNSQLFFMAAASAAGFVIPSLLVHQWDLIDTIPEVHYLPWALPEISGNRKAVIALNSQTIRVKVAPSYFDPNDITITLVQPSREKIGRVFIKALEQLQQQDPEVTLRLSDELGLPYYWEFYEINELLGGRKFLDPDQSLIENSIKENASFVAKRIKQS